MKAIPIRDEAPDSQGDSPRQLDLTAYLDVLLRFRWTFVIAASVCIVIGLLYAMLATPVYRTDIMIQVEEAAGGGASQNRLSAGVAPVLDVKSSSSAEIELLRSRMVVGKAIDTLHLDVEASPQYFPLIGRLIARYNRELSKPGLFGWGGYVWGGESISLAQLDMPEPMEGRRILLKALGGGKYQVQFGSDDATAVGTVGTLLTINTGTGPVRLLVSQLDGRPGAIYVVRKLPRATAITRLQDRLIIAERGKQSGVIGVSLEDEDPNAAAATLTELGNAYVDQNVRRKAAEAEKSLAFLEQQLPQVRQQVEVAETRYNAMRNQRGTVDLSEESKLALTQSVLIQNKVQELKQKRQELAMRFMPTHPAIELIDSQIASLNAQLNGVTGRIQKLPDVEQNVLRLMRDVKVSTDTLQSLLNDMQQLRLMKASKVGTARMVDLPEVPAKPTKPNREVIASVAVLVGLLVGLCAVVVRYSFSGGVADADEIERLTGMTVYSTIPFSAEQGKLAPDGKVDTGLLAHQEPEEPAIETLRGFRTALQFALSGQGNRSVVITGPSPGVGKSFVSANFAAVAAAGRRVLLIDADLRRGGLHHRFNTKRTPGLTELLMGAPLDQVLQRQVAPGLDFIATGAEPPHPADVLLSPAMETLLEAFKGRYDLVVIDTPPILAASDAGILAGKAGAVFLVARAEKTTANELLAAQRALRQAGAEVKGVLLNGLIVEGRWYRSHYYFSKYRYLGEYNTQPAKRA